MMDDEPSPDADFSSLEGVHGMMSDPTNSFAIWLHMVIFDLVVVRMMVLDSVDRILHAVSLSCYGAVYSADVCYGTSWICDVSWTSTGVSKAEQFFFWKG